MGHTHFAINRGTITLVSHEDCPLELEAVELGQVTEIEGTDVCCCILHDFRCPHLEHAGVHGPLVINCNHPEMKDNKYEGSPNIFDNIT